MDPLSQIIEIFKYWIPTAITIGALLDLMAEKKAHDWIRQTYLWQWLMAAQRAPSTDRLRIFNAIDLFYEMVLSNFFDRSPTSKKFIVRSFIYSAVLIIATFLFVFLTNNFSIKEYTIFNIYYYPFYWIFSMVMLVISVVIIDYISFCQTFVFINIAKRAKLSLSVGWIAFANLVLSVNIFSFLFPVALVGLGLLMMRMPEIVDLQAGWMKIESSIPMVNKETIASAPDLNDPYIKENESIILSQTDEKSIIGIYILGSQKIASEYNVTSTFIAISNFQPAALDVQVNRGLQRLIRESQDGYEVTSSEKNNSAIYIPESLVSNLKSLVNLYSIGFTLSSSVRVGFREIISLNPAQVSVNEMASVYNVDHAGSTHRSGALLCFSNGEFHSITLTPKKSISDLENCNQWLYIVGDIAKRVRQIYAIKGYPTVSVPITIFFLSSFGITALIYVAFFTFLSWRVFGWSLQRLSWLVTQPFREKYLNADAMPFSVLATCLGFGFSTFFSFWVMLYWMLGFF